MSKFYDTNLNITKARISNGDIVELEINDKVVDLNSSDLESNKDVSINVSEYSNPVEITPTSGKDGMEKATVTLTNIPSGGSVTLYAWIATNSLFVYTLSATPSVGDDVYGGDASDYASEIREVEEAITAVGENTITVEDETGAIIPNTYTRDSTKDLVLQAGEGGSVTVEPLSVTANGTYTAPSGKAYSPVTVNVPSVNGFAIEFENGDSDGYIFSKVIAFGNAQSVSGAIPAGTYNAFFVTDDVREGETHDFTDIPHLFREPSNVSASVSGYTPNYYTVIISENATPVNSGEYGTQGRSALLVLYPSNM